MLSVGTMTLDAVHMPCMREVLFAFFPLSIDVERGTPQSSTGFISNYDMLFFSASSLIIYILIYNRVVIRTNSYFNVK